MVTRATQEDGDFDIRERARSRLFSRRRDLLSLAPPAPADYALLTEEEHAFARQIDPDHRRRICACRHCVEHALRLWRTSHPAGRPRTDGCRFITVPGLPVPLSTSDQQQRLRRLFSERRELLTLACSCAVCTAHRNAVKAWTRAFDLSLLVGSAPRRREVVTPRP